MIAVLKQKYKSLASDDKFSEILSGSAFALAARVAATGLTLLSSIIVARIYGAEAVGILAVVNSFLLLITIFTVLGTSSSILRLIPEHIAKHSVASSFLVYRKTQYIVAAVSVVTGTIFYFASDIVADKVFSKPHLSSFFALSAGFVVFKSLMDLNTQAVRGLRLIRTFAFMQVLPSLAMLVALGVVTYFFRNPTNPVYAQLSAFAFTAVVGAWIMDRAFKNRMQAADSVQRVSVRGILSISAPMLMTTSIQFFIGQSGVIMLGIFRSESEVGYYSLAVKLATLTAFALQAINSMSAPKFAELYHRGKMDELFYVAKKSTRLIFWTTAPILLGLIILGRPILGLIFGDEFTIAYLAMVLLVLGQFVNSISGSTGNFMNMTGQQKVFRNVIFIAALINICLGFLLIPGFGINGAAFAGLVSQSFWNVYTLIYIKIIHGRTIGYVPLLRLRAQGTNT
jgi:O-antigen/teichoic acid export membrane protein